MTPTQKAAMQQALECLERSVRNYPVGHALSRLAHEQSIAALRAALAETAEPVAEVVKEGATVRLQWVNADAAHNAKPGPLYTAPQPPAPAEAAEPVQRPVGEAHLCDACGTPFDGAYFCPSCGHNTATKEPVYAAPQPPAPSADYKPLTDPHDHPEPHSYKWTQQEMDYINRRVAAAIAAHEKKRGGV